MTGDERAARYLETGSWDPAWGPVPSQLAALRDHLRDPATWSPPPVGGAEAILDAIDEELDDERRIGGDAQRRSWRRGQPLAWLTAAFAAVVVLGAVGITTFVVGDDEPEGRAFTLAGAELMPAARADGLVWSTGVGEWYRLELAGLAPAEPGTYYEGWVHGETGVVSLGTFHARDDRDPVHLWSGVDIDDFPWVTITLQRVGDPDRGPTVLEGAVPTE